VAKYALFLKDEPISQDGLKRIHEVVNSAEECFEVHESFEWVQCPNQVLNRDWKFNTQTNSWVEPAIPVTEYGIARRVHYGEVGAQLDRIFHATQAGATDPLGEWAAEQEKIKAVFPKDNAAYTNESNAEIVRRCNAILEEAERETGVFGKYIDMRQMALDLYDDIQAGRWVNPAA
jgi:hypothetical protein